ncbi:hypothetical protein N7456_002627 [Penicillium angulare]|uniref:Major facilitator superfamily (MFS) profile domain-containing protein n=1 Tax=Penicillium angulare TaxID=116970 RepID=A0A9W9G920_9EURO|nr:hypothetical protein N7456_002627 [Penicillium angulare]
METPSSEPIWGYRWRSSTWFIVTAMATALFTDTFLASFIVPILPYMLEGRIGLDPSRTQSMTSWLLAQNAAVSVIIRIPLAHFADKSPSKRKWFIWALVIAIVSTLATAAGTSLPLLFISRTVQSFASSIMWVVGFTTVANTVPIEHTAKSYAAISMAVSLGFSTGPMLAGVLLQLAGYWAAWSSALVVLLIDVAFRLLMLEKNIPGQKENTKGDTVTKSSSPSERSPLLSTHSDEPETYTEAAPEPNFYKCIFSKSNFTGGVYANFIAGLVVSIFNATVPLHVRDTFGWGGMQSGLIFAALQAPRLVFSPFVGWLKDRVGTRSPTVVGFILLTPAMWALGIPGSSQFPSSINADWGTGLYIAAMIYIGIHATLLNGAGTIEATFAVRELQDEYPGAFGPGGGKSRAIAIAGIALTVGTCVGPVVGGALNDSCGYYVMNCVAAGICFVSAVVAYFTLHSRV